MQITVSLFLAFRTGRFRTKSLEFPERATAADVVEHLALPLSDLGMALINGREVELSHPLADGDRLQLFPVIGGG